MFPHSTNLKGLLWGRYNKISNTIHDFNDNKHLAQLHESFSFFPLWSLSQLISFLSNIVTVL